MISIMMQLVIIIYNSHSWVLNALSFMVLYQKQVRYVETLTWETKILKTIQIYQPLLKYIEHKKRFINNYF